MELSMKMKKDIGISRIVEDALPYRVVGGAHDGSLSANIAAGSYAVLLNHIVPHGQQLKILFLRIWTQESGGAIFRIEQTNPASTGNTGSVEAYPVVNAVPSGARDYPMLEAAGAECLRGSLVDPVHVLEGSIDFRLEGATPASATGNRYSLVWWGVEHVPEPTR